MTSKTLTLALLSALALGTPAPGLALDAGIARQAMAEAMVRMMEAMGLFGAGSFVPWNRVPAVPGPTPPFGGPMGMPGGSPWWGTEMMRQWSQRVPGVAAGAPLDGVWEGGGGDVLIVQDGRYRLYAPQDQYIDGWLQRQAGPQSNRLALYNAQDGHTQVFEYATDDGRLALRGTNGQVYLYRRFGAGAAPGPTSLTPAPFADPAAPSSPQTAGPR